MTKKQLEEIQVKRMYRADELAKYLGCAKSTIWMWSKENKITAIHLSPKVTVFDIQEIHKVFNLDVVGA